MTASNAETRYGVTETDDRGRGATSPEGIPLKGWWDILWRVYGKVNDDRVMLISAGVTFYLLLAVFPALTAFVSVYGFFGNPQTIYDHSAFLVGVLPHDALTLIQGQLEGLVRQTNDLLSFSFVFGFSVALWSANNGVKALFDGMNVAYQEYEKRSFFRLNLISLTFTLGAIFLGTFFLIALGVVPAVLAYANLSSWTEMLVRLARWPILFLVVVTGITLMYRFGPSREKAKWQWLTWGAVIATVVWIIASLGFSYYIENFADYNATYGTLGAVIGLMTWTWISVMIIIVGAEINAEAEHQTEEDSTTGHPKPMGERGAVVADTIGKSA